MKVKHEAGNSDEDFRSAIDDQVPVAVLSQTESYQDDDAPAADVQPVSPAVAKKPAKSDKAHISKASPVKKSQAESRGVQIGDLKAQKLIEVFCSFGLENDEDLELSPKIQLRHCYPSDGLKKISVNKGSLRVVILVCKISVVRSTDLNVVIRV